MNKLENTETTSSSTEIFDAWYEDQLHEDDEKIKSGQEVDFKE